LKYLDVWILILFFCFGWNYPFYLNLNIRFHDEGMQSRYVTKSVMWRCDTFGPSFHLHDLSYILVRCALPYVAACQTCEKVL
jgi:hypothetical protein